MDPHTSLGRLCMDERYEISLNEKIKSEGNWDGPEYQDTVDSGKIKEVKAFTFHRMETEEVCECYITPCFIEGLYAYDGVTDLDYENNLISNEFTIKLGLQYKVKKNGEKVVNRELTKAIVDFGSGTLTIYPDLITFNSYSNDELDALLASINV
ncbi:hypothetical protein Tco_1452328 [Tanacetum coccineum]